MSTAAKIIVLMGYPGSGKGTQARLLEKRMGIHSLSTGEYIRKLKEINEEVRKRYDAGVPQPGEIIFSAIRDQLKNFDPETKAVILDDFPLSLDQAQWLDGIIKEFGFGGPQIFFIRINEDDVWERISKRKVCSECHLPLPPDSGGKVCEKCGGQIITRSDDNLEAVKKRIDEYRARLEELRNYYQKSGDLVEIDGTKSVEEVYGQIEGGLKNRGL